MQSTDSRPVFRRTSRSSPVTRDRLVAMLEDHASREYQAFLGYIGDHQCDSLANFAMAEHMRSLMATTEQGT
jgi:hypothetical protein